MTETEMTDRGTPPDLNGDDIVVWDMVGTPITRRMVDAWTEVCPCPQN